MPIAFYFPEHWNAVFATTGPKWSRRETVTSLLKRL